MKAPQIAAAVEAAGEPAGVETASCHSSVKIPDAPSSMEATGEPPAMEIAASPSSVDATAATTVRGVGEIRC
jgi:hypothetical protein